MSKVTEYFKAYPSVDTFYGTKDGQFFTQKGQAQYHAGKIGKREDVETHKRDVKEDDATEDVPTIKSSKEAIMDYLTSKEIDFDPALQKQELISLFSV